MHKQWLLTARFWAGLFTIFVAIQAGAKDADVQLCERALVPDVYTLNIVESLKPQQVQYNLPLTSPGLTDPWLRLGRRVVAFPDFKFLSDLQKRNLSEGERRQVIRDAKKIRRRVFDQMNAKGDKRALEFAQRAYVRSVINHLFKFDAELKPLYAEIAQPKLRLQTNDADLASAFQGVEETWSKLTRVSPEFSNGSLLPSPFPVVVAGGRFREAYYWDAYFGALGLIATGRRDLAAGQLENFLHMIQVYGRVPNGFRDYYLTRSQPPVISLMALAVYDDAAKNNIAASKLKKWMSERVFPLLKHDYHNFWMKLRFDSATGLNHYSDDLNQPRPERHSLDRESELGETFRDVRAEAESGYDFTESLMGRGSRVLSVSLNALLYRYEVDLARMAEIAGDREAAQAYTLASERRRFAINKYLWDAKDGVYRNFNLDTGKQAEVVHADQFAMLYAGAATKAQAAAVEKNALALLEKAGGLASSTSQSGKQWDGDHGWAPLHVMAIQGLANYGHQESAERLARKWVTSVVKIHRETGAFHEKIDVAVGGESVEDGTKYPTQTGFLWTNASFVWALKFLGLEFTPL